MSGILKNVIQETPNQLGVMRRVKAHMGATTCPEVLQSGVLTGGICVITAKVPREIQKDRKKVIRKSLEVVPGLPISAFYYDVPHERQWIQFLEILA
jgi:hypothetical protein